MTKDYLTRQFELFYNKLPKTDPTSIQNAVNEYLDEHPADGKSAYESAVDGGYAGTKTEFDTALSDINMTKSEMLDILRGGES